MNDDTTNDGAMSNEAMSDMEIVQATIEQGQAAEDEPAVPAEFSVYDDATANWLIRRILEARAYAERCKIWCEKEQARAAHEEAFFMFRYGPQLVEYVRGKIQQQGGRRKSINLPAGMAGFRKESPKIIIDDEGLVMAWAKEHHPDLICITERLSKSKLNEYVDTTGEIPETGLHIEPEREKFYVR